MAKLEVIRGGEVQGVANLLSKVRKARADSPTGAVWLRGLTNDAFRLVPSIGRPQTFANQTVTFNVAVERRLLHRFRRFAYEFVGRELSPWETLLVARHHGLPVRLLDWTTSPSAALYFACEFKHRREFPDERIPNAKIWMLIPNSQQDDRLDVFDETQDPLEVKGVRLVYPMVVAPRINAQSGHFTIQGEPQKSLDDLADTDYAEADMDVIRIIELIVPGEKRAEWLQELHDQGMSRRTLFPDLDGLSAGLLSAQILRKDGGSPVAVT